MIQPLKLIAMLALAGILFSCAALKASMTQVSLGMTKTEVESALKIKPDNVVSAERIAETNSVVEVLQYTMVENGQYASYWLYFVNNKLDKWHRLKKHHASVASSLNSKS